MATTLKARRGVVWWVLLAVTLYALLSISIGVATADACGRLNDDKTWQFFPPGWECPARTLPGQR